MLRLMPFFKGVTGSVHYRVWRVDEPAAVVAFAHGVRQHSGQYHRFARALNARGIELWALDHAGHGLSEGNPDEGAPIADLAANVVALSEIAKPTVLMGHSLGAVTVLAVPTAVRLVLCGTPKRVAEEQVPTSATLIVHGVDDRLAPIDPIRQWVRGAPNITMLEYADAGHDLLHEPIHARVTADVADFVLSE